MNEETKPTVEEQVDLFEELSVTELEDRLELASRCLCRIGK